MDAILTLIAAPDKANLDGPAVGRAVGALDAQGAGGIQPPIWLTDGVACEIGFAGLAPETAQAAAVRALDGRPVDAVAQPRAGRRKRLQL